MLRLVRNTWITLECHPEDCWVGAFWERRQTRYRTWQGVVKAELHVWVCLVPCFPLHIIHTTGLRRSSGGDELRRSEGFLSDLPTREIPGMTRSWLTRRSH
jgi:hypothetical protein